MNKMGVYDKKENHLLEKKKGCCKNSHILTQYCKRGGRGGKPIRS